MYMKFHEYESMQQGWFTYIYTIFVPNIGHKNCMLYFLCAVKCRVVFRPSIFFPNSNAVWASIFGSDPCWCRDIAPSPVHPKKGTRCSQFGSSDHAEPQALTWGKGWNMFYTNTQTQTKQYSKQEMHNNKKTYWLCKENTSIMFWRIGS